MFRNRLYYRFKPLIPRNLRLAIRRSFAQRKRRFVQNVWPILPGSEKKPAGWSGWPNGKQFAVVLTHDVEGPEGLANCLDLARIEKDLGFRSSFNFIPEGSYQVQPAVREQLQNDGFEVGVHDLQHNGKLFQNRTDFRRKAQRINHYLRAWNAVGFRSGFMLHNLDWLHDLNVAYDASTFDTDPFEPQPEGRHTIFPFWVENSKAEGSPSDFQHLPKSGYIELPYTLPQDSTVFLLLQEQSPAIWKRKFEWVAENGGMVLINVHPDYMSMDHPNGTKDRYPVRFYIEFLKHVSQYGDSCFWHGLPKELAHLCTRQGGPAISSENTRASAAG